MAKLSAIIPSRDERFLLPTIHDLFRNARGEFEVVAVLDSDRWPEGWKEITDQYPNLHTIHNGTSLGMRASINRGVMSAISRGAKYILKSDGHCSFSEGFDEVLKAECEPNWVVVPRRGRLDPENWVATETHKPDIDYHYLSFPDNPSDWGGKGLNGKPWPERAIERKDILLDEEMSSQGSAWFMHASYFEDLLLMDEISYGSFWNEFQEIGLKCWLSGGKVMVNKKAKYLHLHKGTKYGRGYRLAESQLQQGAGFTKNWIWNDAWLKQTLPFKWLIEHFWPVPTWPDNWEEVLYATRKPRAISTKTKAVDDTVHVSAVSTAGHSGDSGFVSGLTIHNARYGIANPDPPFQWGDNSIDVAERVRALIKNDSLDIVVNNSTLTPDQNPFRGKKKLLLLTYSYNGGEQVTIEREEKDWLIIGPVGESRKMLVTEVEPDNQLREWTDIAEWKETEVTGPTVKVFRQIPQNTVGETGAGLAMATLGGEDEPQPELGFAEKYCPYCGRVQKLHPDGTFPTHATTRTAELREVNPPACKGSGKEYIRHPSYRSIDAKSGAYVPAEVAPMINPPRTPAALNDYLIRKFSISPQRLRGPMPIELRDFHRNDLAQLFAELGFKRGAEIGVAEGNYSEVLLKANPECELLLVDPWHHYSDNPQGKSKEKHEFAFNETRRKAADYPNAKMVPLRSMDVIHNRKASAEISDESLDFFYCDGNHLFDYAVSDLIWWSKKLRSGGIASGDDYYSLDQRRWIGGGVVEAVQAYVNAHRIGVWFLCSGHKSVDYFWCKP